MEIWATSNHLIIRIMHCQDTKDTSLGQKLTTIWLRHILLLRGSVSPLNVMRRKITGSPLQVSMLLWSPRLMKLYQRGHTNMGRLPCFRQLQISGRIKCLGLVETNSCIQNNSLSQTIEISQLRDLIMWRAPKDLELQQVGSGQLWISLMELDGFQKRICGETTNTLNTGTGSIRQSLSIKATLASPIINSDQEKAFTPLNQFGNDKSFYLSNS